MTSENYKDSESYKKLRKLFLISFQHPNTKLYFRDTTSVKEHRKAHAESSYWFVIHPFSLFRCYWEPFMAFIYVMMLVLVPLTIISNYDRIFPREHTYDKLAAIITIFRFFLKIDIILRFFTGRVIKDQREIVLSPWKIAVHYLRGYFITDVLAAIPTNFITFCLYGNERFLISKDQKIFFDLLAQMSLVRFLTACRYAIQFIESPSVYYVNSNEEIQLILMVFLGLLIMCNWFSQFYMLLHEIVFEYFHERVFWIDTMYMMMSGELIKTLPWLLLFLKALNQIIGMDEVPYLYESTYYGYMLSSAVLVCGAFMLQFINVLLFLVISSDEPPIKYHAEIKQVQKYMTNNEFPLPLQLRVLENYEHKYQGRYFNETLLKKLLPLQLQLKLRRSRLNHLVQNSEIFKRLSEEELKVVLMLLKYELYLAGDKIYKSGSVSDSVYFLDYGTVAMYTGNGREVCHFKDGDFFGSLALDMSKTKETRRTTSTDAVEVCHIYKMDRLKFRLLVLGNKTMEKIVNVQNLTLSNLIARSLAKQRNSD